MDKDGVEEGLPDDLIGDIVRNGARTLPSADFENQVMRKIQMELDHKNEVTSQLRTSLRFFLGALLTGTGLLVVVLFGQVFTQFGGSTFAILALFILGLVGIMNIENYKRIIRNYSS